MESKRTPKPSYSRLLDSTFQTFKTNPAVYLPFLIFALIELTALIVLFLAPRSPANVLLGPPIRRLYGEQFLHYPYDLTLLPKLYYYAQ